MTTEQISQLDDESLRQWHDATMVAHILEEEGVADKLRILQQSSRESNQDLAYKIDDEEDRRIDAATKADVDRTLASPEPEQVETLEDKNRLLAYRAARLLKLLSLNAPDVIVDHSFEMLVKARA